LYRHFIVGVTFKGWRNMLQKNKKNILTHTDTCIILTS
jgi:hypothetical protein